jgi:hypothetical protein
MLDRRIQPCGRRAKNPQVMGANPQGWTRLPYLLILAHLDRPHLHLLMCFGIVFSRKGQTITNPMCVEALKLASVKMGA